MFEIGGVPEATTMSDYFLGTSAFGPGADIDPLIRQHCCHTKSRFSEYLSRNV
jgi:hypothetical protein